MVLEPSCMSSAVNNEEVEVDILFMVLLLY
jgi:hypothetical protein